MLYNYQASRRSPSEVGKVGKPATATLNEHGNRPRVTLNNNGTLATVGEPKKGDS